eukprot:9599659-Lingulodinium_polyedra.AAC.1
MGPRSVEAEICSPMATRRVLTLSVMPAVTPKAWGAPAPLAGQAPTQEIEPASSEGGVFLAPDTAAAQVA